MVYLLFRLFRAWIRRRADSQLPHLREVLPNGQRPIIVGCFHPYCNAGGGGERVLWVAVRALQKRYSNVRCVIYTGDTDVSPNEILDRVQQRFNIVLPRSGPNDIHFVYLRRRIWVEASRYPVFTLLGQSLGSVVLGLEALFACIPDIYLDTMGYAFTLPVFRYLGGCNTGCYVHYPTISTDMLDRVAQRRTTYNNAGLVSRSRTLSRLKLVYYRVFAWMYGIAGRRSDIVMVNSSWTYNHIVSLWNGLERTFIVNPPCDVREFLSIPLTKERKRSIISVAQFRPEKDHGLQIASFNRFLKLTPAEERSQYRLVLVGGCRNEEDAGRVEYLRELAKEMNVSDSVEFCLNVPFDELKQKLSESAVGIHTMWNEHFGISVVECMAAGTIVLAHDSGGPKFDIVVEFNDERTGFLASDVDSYSEALRTIFSLSSDEQMHIRTNARESVARFSDSEFEEKFVKAMDVLFSNFL